MILFLLQAAKIARSTQRFQLSLPSGKVSLCLVWLDPITP